MTRFKPVLLAAAIPALLLAACTSEDGTEGADGNAAGDSALSDELMYDTDLAGSNEANGAVTSADATLPEQVRSPEAMQRARAKAVNLVGGPGKMKSAPEAVEVGDIPEESTIHKAMFAANSPGGNGNCADKASYTMEWVAKLPAAFPVYPDGSAMQAAGNSDGKCALRVVGFLSAMPVKDIIDFYYTRASEAGFSAQHVQQGDDNVLGGSKGNASFVVYARKLESGVTEVDLITNGA
jgi:hypothetical protein